MLTQYNYIHTSADAGYTVVVISLLSLGTFVEAVVWTQIHH